VFFNEKQNEKDFIFFEGNSRWSMNEVLYDFMDGFVL